MAAPKDSLSTIDKILKNNIGRKCNNHLVTVQTIRHSMILYDEKKWDNMTFEKTD